MGRVGSWRSRRRIHAEYLAVACGLLHCAWLWYVVKLKLVGMPLKFVIYFAAQ